MGPFSTLQNNSKILIQFLKLLPYKFRVFLPNTPNTMFRPTTKTLMFLALAISIAYSEKYYYSKEFINGGLYVRCGHCVGGADPNCQDHDHWSVYGRGDNDLWFRLQQNGKWAQYMIKDFDMHKSRAKPLGDSFRPDYEESPETLTESHRADLTKGLTEAIENYHASHSGDVTRRRLTAAELLARRKPSKPPVVLERLLEQIRRANGM